MTTRSLRTLSLLALPWLAACVEGAPAEAPFYTEALPHAIELSHESLILGVGDTVTVVSVVLNEFDMPVETNVGWESSDESVVTVLDVSDDGLVEAVGAGTTTVQATVLGTTVPPATVTVTVN